MEKIKNPVQGKKRSITVTNLVLCAMFAALMSICSQIQIPLPMVPINLALFGAHLCGAILGAKYGTLSLIVYVLMGMVGLPVYAGFSGGVAVLFGKTGGYIIGYVLDAFVVGWLVHRWGKGFVRCCGAMVIGAVVCYIFGTVWFMYVTGLGLWVSLIYCVFPFLAGDAVKIVLAAYLTRRLKIAGH